MGVVSLNLRIYLLLQCWKNVGLQRLSLSIQNLRNWLDESRLESAYARHKSLAYLFYLILARQRRFALILALGALMAKDWRAIPCSQ